MMRANIAQSPGRRQALARVLGLGLALLVAAGCSSATGPQFVQGTGTVRYQSLEGGFYGIVGDDGRHLDPRNLPAPFQLDGLRIHYRGYLVSGASVHMWGALVQLTSVDPAP